ncbi:MAG: hypothetical protein J0H29_23875 [Sphingobacteriales bacterium]|nr:hypothetical protein [Sphingobacteriales bacterium]OJY80939.1 MAG: hypothetical protein BGP14_01740 [Sphingobacteriales bacterium 44-15]
MRTKKIKLSLVVLLVVISLVTTAGIGKWLHRSEPEIPAENGTIVFKKLYAKLADFNEDLNISGIITLYDGEEVKEKTSFELLRQKYRVYHRIDYIKQIGNENISVQLDTVNKYLWVGKPDKEMLRMQRKGMIPFGDLMADTSFFKIVSIPGERPAIEIFNDYQPEIKSCVLMYDPQNYIIRQAVIQWWKHPGSIENREYYRTVTDYQYNAAAAMNIDELLKSIVTVNRKKVEVNSAYAEYRLELANNLNN